MSGEQIQQRGRLWIAEKQEYVTGTMTKFFMGGVDGNSEPAVIFVDDTAVNYWFYPLAHFVAH